MRHPTINIREVINLIRPNADCILRDNDYDQLEWHDQVQSKPTIEEIEVGAIELANLAYREQRRVSYPAIGDQLDAIWKGGDDAAAMLATVMAVKAQYPKPE